jgi:hypothetical protein
MIRADSAKMEWDPSKKHWHIQIHVGGEVIKRSCPKLAEGTADDALRSDAVQTAKDEGYELDPTRVEIAR